MLEALERLSHETPLQPLWVGGQGGMEEELVRRAGVPFAPIPAAGLHGVGLRLLPRNLIQMGRGLAAARQILRRFRPQVLFLTGGYVAGPVVLAGRGIPTLLYVPDIEPGLALKALARFADQISVTAEESQRYFSRKVVVTGYPLRSSLMMWTRQKGREALRLDGRAPVLLIFGGSKGARSLNRAVLAHLPDLLEMAQVVHITGRLDWETVAEKARDMSPALRARYHAFPYLHEEMGAALASADLVVARAGASALGEFPFFGLPAVLVPYPHAWRYQKVNADYLSQRGAAVIVKDEFLAQELLPVVRDLLLNKAKREAMRQAMRTLARPQAAHQIAEQLLALGAASL